MKGAEDPLKTYRRNFLRENKPREYRRMRREGTLEAHLEQKAAACRREAARLVEQGITFEEQAWHWAIRSVLLETPPD